MVVKVEYQNGSIKYFMWIKGKYGYFRKGNKILRYPLPKNKQT